MNLLADRGKLKHLSTRVYFWLFKDGISRHSRVRYILLNLRVLGKPTTSSDYIVYYNAFHTHWKREGT